MPERIGLVTPGEINVNADGFKLIPVSGGMMVETPNGKLKFFGSNDKFAIDPTTGSVVKVHPPATRCFLAGTPILLPDGASRPIEEIAVGDEVACFAGGGSFDGAVARAAPLEAGRVVRLFRNVTDEVLAIRYADPDTGEAQVVHTTPGHVMLTASGRFMEARRALMAGEALVLADGRAVKARHELIRFASAEGERLSASHPAFAPVTDLVTRDEHGLALSPRAVTGWRSHHRSERLCA